MAESLKPEAFKESDVKAGIGRTLSRLKEINNILMEPITCQCGKTFAVFGILESPLEAIPQSGTDAFCFYCGEPLKARRVKEPQS